MPKKSVDQDNSRIARRNLEDFCRNWNISRLDDDSSGTEYGQDWMIGIVSESGDVTGMEFRVQSKVLRGKKAIQGDYICDQISVSTVNYLYDLSVPVLFHFYHKPTKRGYVMWLDEWYIQNKKDKWDQQQSVLVKIPLSSVLDEQMVNQLHKYIWERHHKHGLRKTVDLINETSSDYNLKIDFVGNDTWVVVDAKHDGAIPSVTPLDAEAEAALKKALELGVPVPITGKIGITNIPSVLLGEMQLVSLSVIPRLMDLPKFPIRVQYFDESGQIVYETKYVDMVPIQHGSVIKKWEGNAFSNPLKYVFEYNSVEQTYGFHLGLRDDEKNPANIVAYFDAVEKIARAKNCKVLDPRTDDIYIDSPFAPDFQFSDTGKAIQALAKALAAIATFTDIFIEMPSTFSGDDVMSAEGVETILTSGVYNQLVGKIFPDEDFVLILTGTKEWANHVENSLNTDVEPLSYIHQGPREVHTTVLNHDIDLGACEFVFEDLRLLEKRSESDNGVQLVFAFSREKTYTRFPKWYKEK